MALSVEARITELEVQQENLSVEVKSLHHVVHGKNDDQHRVWNDMQDGVRAAIADIDTHLSIQDARQDVLEAKVSELQSEMAELKSEVSEMKIMLQTLLDR